MHTTLSRNPTFVFPWGSQVVLSEVPTHRVKTGCSGFVSHSPTGLELCVTMEAAVPCREVLLSLGIRLETSQGHHAASPRAREPLRNPGGPVTIPVVQDLRDVAPVSLQCLSSPLTLVANMVFVPRAGVGGHLSQEFGH